MRALLGSARLLHLAFGDNARASLSLSLVSLLPLSLTSTSQYARMMKLGIETVVDPLEFASALDSLHYLSLIHISEPTRPP